MRAPRAEYSQADTAENYRELERWANERAPIFPVYSVKSRAAGTSVLGHNQPVEFLDPIELVVQKKFDWTVLAGEVEITCFANTVAGVIAFYAVPNYDITQADMMAWRYFNSTSTHQGVYGRADGIPQLRAGEHVITLYASFISTTATMDVNDFVRFRVQEQPPQLASGESWI